MQQSPIMPAPPQGMKEFSAWFYRVFTIWSRQWGVWTGISFITMSIYAGIALAFIFSIRIMLMPAGFLPRSSSPYAAAFPNTIFVTAQIKPEMVVPFFVVTAIAVILLVAAMTWLVSGLVKTGIKAARNHRIHVGDLFSAGDRFWPVLGFFLLWVLISVPFAIGFGLLKKVVNGGLVEAVNILVSLILGSLLFLAVPYVVDRPSGSAEAFGTSWKTVSRSFWSYALFFIVMEIFSFLGVLAC
jgi:hypothetical protein